MKHKLERVMVWQTEILTPNTLKQARNLIMNGDPVENRKKLRTNLRKRFGRFWLTTIRRLKKNTKSDEVKNRIYRFLHPPEDKEENNRVDSALSTNK